MGALKLQYFRAACAIVDADYNVSRAADGLYATQSAVSKTIKGLEDELGVAVFSRAASRMKGLTPYGEEFIGLARHIVRDADFAMSRARDDIRETRGVLKIANSHVHSKYTVPRAIKAFNEKYPDVTIELEQGDARYIVGLVSSRRAHIGIISTHYEHTAALQLPAGKLSRSIVVPRGHELVGMPKPSLADLARYKLVCYAELSPGGSKIHAAFKRAGLNPNVTLTSTDATALKQYVAAGIGIAILPTVAITPNDEREVALIDASHLFPDLETHVVVRPGEHLRSYAYDFIEAFAPRWTRRLVQQEIAKQNSPCSTVSALSELPEHAQADVA